jgi:hypothetical protein
MANSVHVGLYKRETLERWRTLFLPTFTATHTRPDGTVRGSDRGQNSLLPSVTDLPPECDPEGPVRLPATGPPAPRAGNPRNT